MKKKLLIPACLIKGYGTLIFFLAEKSNIIACVQIANDRVCKSVELGLILELVILYIRAGGL